MTNKAEINEDEYQEGFHPCFKAKPYSWLIERLSAARLGRLESPQPGCRVNLPDIAFFKAGKIAFAAMTNAKGEAVVKHSAAKLSLHKLRLIFSTKVRKRRMLLAPPPK
jgi:hypothetical protein